MSRTMQNRPTVLVTDSGRGSALSIIRSLGRKGWHIIAGDSDSSSLGFRSKYTSESLVYPLAETASAELVALLLKTAKEKHIDLIVPVTDVIILPLSQARAQFEGVCKLAIAEPDQIETVTDKMKTLALAERLNIPTPKTKLVETADEAREVGPSLGFPIVLKPQVSRLYRREAKTEAFTVTYGKDSDHLYQEMKRFEGRCAVLLQEYYHGSGQGVELLTYKGQPLAAFQHRRLREVPLTGGASSFREGVPLDPMLYDYALRLLQTLNWTGLAMVEFKVGDNGAKLMEINGRVWGSLPLAVHSGMDFPARMAEMYVYGPPNGQVKPDVNYKVGVRSRSLDIDMVWIAQVLRGKKRYPFLTMPRRWQGITALLGLFNPTYKFDILSFDDLRPGLIEIPKLIAKLRRKIREAE